MNGSCYQRQVFRTTALAIVALAVGGSPAQEVAAPPPRIEITQPVIDLGELERGVQVDAAFEIRNTGGRSLHLLDVKPG